MNRNPQELGAVATEGEARAAASKHGTWGAIKRHRKASEALCGACRGFHRAYYREYEQTRRRSAVERTRRAAAQQQWRERNRAAIRDYSQRYYRQQLAELRICVDLIAVERACDFHRPLPRLNRAEKISAYNEMMRLRVPRRQVVERLRISWATAQVFDARVSENYLHPVCTDGQNDSEAEQDCSPARPLTDTPAYPGGRLMPSIAAHQGDSCQRVAG